MKHPSSDMVIDGGKGGHGGRGGGGEGEGGGGEGGGEGEGGGGEGGGTCDKNSSSEFCQDPLQRALHCCLCSGGYESSSVFFRA